MLNTFFNKFLPKEPKFFPLLRKLSDILVETTNILIECVSDNNHENSANCFKKIKEQERKADKISNKVFDELNVTFITPFDREDINALANRLDDVIDYITSCAKRIALYKPKQMPESALQLANYLKDSAEYLSKAVVELDILKKNSKNITEYCGKVHNLENLADDVYDLFVMELFENEKDGIEVIKLKEIMYELEKATDAADHVGKILKTIIVKYA